MSETKAIPAPHRYAVCAEVGMPIKEFYKDEFEEVFIIFHPFIKPKTIDFELFIPDTFPDGNAIIEHCDRIKWKEFLKISGIKDYRQLDIGLRTLIASLNKYANEKLAKQIDDVCNEKKIVPPVVGSFPAFEMKDILQYLKEEGYDWLWCGDEFCTERKLEYVEDLIAGKIEFLNNPINVFTHNNEILLTTHWDNHFSMLCSDKSTTRKIVESCGLEGFYCNEKTEIDWSLTGT
ncbi:DUF2711 family protein [Virgibacillus flavescens]|uniref:DUF2711 family protein n=1 Tax=Virgibacillus flavescens TaxID=1611422 RepID=UPI003D356AC4